MTVNKNSCPKRILLWFCFCFLFWLCMEYLCIVCVRGASGGLIQCIISSVWEFSLWKKDSLKIIFPWLWKSPWINWCQRDVTPVHQHWSYVSFSPNHRHKILVLNFPLGLLLCILGLWLMFILVWWRAASEVSQRPPWTWLDYCARHAWRVHAVPKGEWLSPGWESLTAHCLALCILNCFF